MHLLARTAGWVVVGIGVTAALAAGGGFLLSGELRQPMKLALLYAFVGGLAFPLLLAPAALVAARWLARRRALWALALGGILAFPVWLFFLTRVEAFDYGYNPFAHPVDWLSFLPILAGAVVVLAGCRRSAVRAAA